MNIIQITNYDSQRFDTDVDLIARW